MENMTRGHSHQPIRWAVAGGALLAVLSLSAALPVLLLHAQQGLPGPAQPGVLQPEQITREQFDRLPDHQVIDVKGTRMTAGQIRMRMQQARARAEAKMKEEAQKAQAEFEAYRSRFEQDRKARLDAENAKVRAEFERLRQQRPKLAPRAAGAPQTAGRDAQLNAVRQEARQLLERSKTASPAERQQIEQRAAQLIQQLQQMGVSAPVQQPGGQVPQRQLPLGR